jgi:hypothetical protein
MLATSNTPSLHLSLDELHSLPSCYPISAGPNRALQRTNAAMSKVKCASVGLEAATN